MTRIEFIEKGIAKYHEHMAAACDSNSCIVDIGRYNDAMSIATSMTETYVPALVAEIRGLREESDELLASCEAYRRRWR